MNTGRRRHRRSPKFYRTTVQIGLKPTVNALPSGAVRIRRPAGLIENGRARHVALGGAGAWLVPRNSALVNMAVEHSRALLDTLVSVTDRYADQNAPGAAILDGSGALIESVLDEVLGRNPELEDLIESYGDLRDVLGSYVEAASESLVTVSVDVTADLVRVGRILRQVGRTIASSQDPTGGATAPGVDRTTVWPTTGGGSTTIEFMSDGSQKATFRDGNGNVILEVEASPDGSQTITQDNRPPAESNPGENPNEDADEGAEPGEEGSEPEPDETRDGDPEAADPPANEDDALLGIVPWKEYEWPWGWRIATGIALSHFLDDAWMVDRFLVNEMVAGHISPVMAEEMIERHMRVALDRPQSPVHVHAVRLHWR